MAAKVVRKVLRMLKGNVFMLVRVLLTPDRHENGKEDCGAVVEEVSHPRNDEGKGTYCSCVLKL